MHKMESYRSSRFSLAVALFLLTNGAGDATAGLISEWRFDETGGTTAYDSVGGINGTLSGGATFDPGAGPGQGIYSGAISLSTATDSYVSMGNVYNFTSGDFSIVSWVKTTDTGGQFSVSRHHTGFENGYFIALNNVGDGAGDIPSHFYATGPVAGSSVNVEDGNWHQLVAVYQAGVGTRYYVDGTFQESGAAPTIGANDAPFMVGGVDSFGTLVGTFNGLIADVRSL